MENIDEQSLTPATNEFVENSSKEIASHLWDNKPIDFGLFMSKLEISILMILFRLTNSNKSVLSGILKIPRTTLNYKLKIPVRKNEEAGL